MSARDGGLRLRGRGVVVRDQRERSREWGWNDRLRSAASRAIGRTLRPIHAIKRVAGRDRKGAKVYLGIQGQKKLDISVGFFKIKMQTLAIVGNH